MFRGFWGFLNWFLAELSSSLRPWVVNPGGVSNWAPRITIDTPDETDGAFVRSLARTPRRSAVDIVLGEAFVVTRDVTFPKKAASKSQHVLALDLQSHAPVPIDRLAWAETGRTVDGDTIKARQTVARRSDLDDLLSQVTRSGRRIRSVLVADQSGGEVALVDNTVVADRSKRFWWASAAAACAALAIGIWSERERFNATLEAEVSGLRTQVGELGTRAVALTEAGEVREAEADTQRRALTALQAGTDRLATLAQLTTALPDTAWVAELEMSQTQSRLAGFSRGDVPSLLEGLSDALDGAQVELTRPVTTDRVSRQKRFEILISRRSVASYD